MDALELFALLILWTMFRVTSLALVIWFEAHYPDAADRIRTTYTDRGRRCVLLGLFNLFAWILVAVLLISTQVLALFGLAVLACLAAASIIGVTPAYRELGQRIDGEAKRSRFRNIAYGFICLETAFLTPVIGQALAFGVLVRGLGAVITTVLAMRRLEAPPLPASVQATPPSEADVAS